MSYNVEGCNCVVCPDIECQLETILQMVVHQPLVHACGLPKEIKVPACDLETMIPGMQFFRAHATEVLSRLEDGSVRCLQDRSGGS